MSTITLTHSGARLLAQAMAAYQRLEPHQVRMAEDAAPARNPMMAITLASPDKNAVHDIFFGEAGLTVESSEAGPLAPEYLPPEDPAPSSTEDTPPAPTGPKTAS